MGEKDAIKQGNGAAMVVDGSEGHSDETSELPDRLSEDAPGGVAADGPEIGASETSATVSEDGDTDNSALRALEPDAAASEAATDDLLARSAASEDAGDASASGDDTAFAPAGLGQGTGSDPGSDDGASAGDSAAALAAQEFEPPARAAAELKAILEALIFASPEPLSLKALTKLLDSEPQEDVATALDGLKEDYERPGGLQLVEVAGGYQIVTRHDLHEWVRRLFHERSTQKLSAQALETLAVVAYRQPITAVEITEIRGVNTSGVLNTLLERHLIKIVGRKAVVGRPFMYSTTKEFLGRFGLNDLTDLPRVEDMVDALGLEAPLLVERAPLEDQLPLEEPDAESDEAMPGEAADPEGSDKSDPDGGPGGSIH